MLRNTWQWVKVPHSSTYKNGIPPSTIPYRFWTEVSYRLIHRPNRGYIGSSLHFQQPDFGIFFSMIHSIFCFFLRFLVDIDTPLYKPRFKLVLPSSVFQIDKFLQNRCLVLLNRIWVRHLPRRHTTFYGILMPQLWSFLELLFKHARWLGNLTWFSFLCMIPKCTPRGMICLLCGPRWQKINIHFVYLLNMRYNRTIVGLSPDSQKNNFCCSHYDPTFLRYEVQKWPPVTIRQSRALINVKMHIL